jgi:hypothetical protein
MAYRQAFQADARPPQAQDRKGLSCEGEEAEKAREEGIIAQNHLLLN